MVGRGAAWGMPALILPTLIGIVLAPNPRCAADPLPGGAPVLVRVDGTRLSDWQDAEPLRALLADAAAASLLLPRSIEHAPRVEVAGAGDWFDPGLGGRRIRAATHAAWGTRAEIIGDHRTAAPPAEAGAGTDGTFVTTSPDARPIAFSGTAVNGTRADANWPTGYRTDIDALRSAITTTLGPLEIDVGDVWRLDHARLPAQARAAYARDVLGSIVAPLIADALDQQRPVALVSLLPSLDEQRAERWRGAVAILGFGRGLLSSPGLDAAATTRRDPGIASQPTMSGTIDVSRLLGAIGLTVVPDRSAGATTTDARCLLGSDGDDVPGAQLDADLRAAAASHEAAATVLLGALTAAALLASWLLARARRAPVLRILLAVAAVAALLLPVALIAEGTIGGSTVARSLLLAAVIAPASALVAWLPTRSAIGIAGGIGAAAGLIELARYGRSASASLLAAPLDRGIRSEGPDALLIALTVTGLAAASAWRTDARIPRTPAALQVAFLTLAATLLLAPSGVPLAALLAIAAAGATGLAALHARPLARIATIVAAGTLVTAFAVLLGDAHPLDGRFEALVLLRAGAQPTLWPLLALLVAALLLVRLRLSERHGDVLARASFGAPTWRTAETTLLVLAPVLAFSIGAGTYAAAILVLLALLVGRVR